MPDSIQASLSSKVALGVNATMGIGAFVAWISLYA